MPLELFKLLCQLKKLLSFTTQCPLQGYLKVLFSTKSTLKVNNTYELMTK